MKKIIALGLLTVAAVFGSNAVHANTHLKVADIGEVVISKDGNRLAINNDKEKFSLLYANVTTMRENGCDVSIFSNVEDNKDIATLTLCDKLKPMVKFGRYYDGKKQGGWLIDASRYMTFDKE